MLNSVELIGWYGNDTTHALSAWTSTSRELTEQKTLRIPKLLKFLAENEHYTPFEKSTLHFLVTCDTASHIHLLKHRVGVSVNAESARYKELKDDKFLVPNDWPPEIRKKYDRVFRSLYIGYHLLIKDLENSGMERKRAKESARFALPYANQLTLDVTFNFRSFMHFQKLRNAPDAQVEIAEVAARMLELVRGTGDFTHSIRAYGY